MVSAKRQSFFRFAMRVFFLLLCCAIVTACGPNSNPADGPIELTLWFHSAQPSERAVMNSQVDWFNQSQNDIRVRMTVIPEGSYNGQVQAAAVARDLPDLLEFDGPYVYNYVWQGILIPLGDRLSADIQNDLLPSIVAQGTYRDRFYAVGVYDSGLGLYARRSRLEAAGARIPDGPGDAWTVEEFEEILADLAETDPDGKVLDLKLNYGGEYFTYAYSPPIQSAGGDLIDRSDYPSADGVLNGPEAVGVMKRYQRWMERGLVDLNLDDAAFTAGRVALSWVGHWEYGRYRDAAGGDLLVLPLPDFGNGTRTGQGSWNWGITRDCDHPEAAVRFLEFLLSPEEILAMTQANGAVPATRTAISRSELYGEDGPLRLFAVQLLEGYGVPRPRTPAYPIISSAFARAFHAVRNGADVRETLDRAVRVIDRDIAENEGYPPVAVDGD